MHCELAGELGQVINQAIDQVRQAVVAFDPLVVDGTTACGLVEMFSELERLAGAGKLLAAGRAAGTGAWAVSGNHRSAESWLAAVTHTSFGQATAAITTARQVAKLPEVEVALRAGELSGVQAEAVSAAATADPDAERQLLVSAATNGLRGLKNDCARVAAAACIDEMAAYERLRKRRSLRAWQDPDGMGRIDVRGPIDATAKIMAALEPYERELFDKNRKAGEHLSPDITAFDALLAMAETHGVSGGTGGTTKSPPATVVVHVSHEAFIRGHTQPGAVPAEICEIAGVGPIPVAVARELAQDAFLKALITDGTDIVCVTHMGRVIPQRLRTAVETRDRECVIRGCHVTRHLEIDHNDPVAHGGPTTLANLHRLCHHHHRQKHRDNARLTGSGTQMTLTPAARPPP